MKYGFISPSGFPAIVHDATQTDSVTPMICQNNRKLEARAVVKYLILRGGVGGGGR